MLLGSNGNSYTVCTVSDMCMYVYIYTSQYRDGGWAKEIRRTWDSSDCRVPFWTCVPQDRQPWPVTRHETTEGYKKCNSTLSLTSALVGGWVVNATLRLLYRLCGPQGRSGRVREISPPPRFDPRTVYPVANRYTELAIPAQNIMIK